MKAGGQVQDDRVHLIGFSGGAKLIYEIVATPGFPHAIRSIATVAGAFGLFHADRPEEGFSVIQLDQGTPVSALLAQGGLDPKLPAAGGLDETGRESHTSFRTKVDYWRLVTGTETAASATGGHPRPGADGAGGCHRLALYPGRADRRRGPRSQSGPCLADMGHHGRDRRVVRTKLGQAPLHPRQGGPPPGGICSSPGRTFATGEAVRGRDHLQDRLDLRRVARRVHHHRSRRDQPAARHRVRFAPTLLEQLLDCLGWQHHVQLPSYRGCTCANSRAVRNASGRAPTTVSVGIRQTFTSYSNPKGNADTERFLRTLKEELVWLREWTSPSRLLRRPRSLACRVQRQLPPFGARLPSPECVRGRASQPRQSLSRGLLNGEQYRRTTTYAIRLAVEGGGQVKAELVSVGQSGEQSLKRIESAGDRASGGLKGLGRQAELLRTGIRTLGGALIGAATVGGLGALIDRSISAADAIGKTADKIGVGVEALQELRFAAKASGVEQQTLDMALQRFTRRAAEAAQGTGEAKDALAQMGIALRDQSGNLRSSEDLLGDVADAFARIEDPAERVRLAFKLFDSEGVALVNLLRGGSDALEEMRERARDLTP